jgi:hypothetical protein
VIVSGRASKITVVQLEGTTNAKTVLPSHALLQERAETPPAIWSHGSAFPKVLMLKASLVVFVLTLVVGVTWSAVSKLNQASRTTELIGGKLSTI